MTVISENQVVMRCGYEIAKQVGIIKAVPRPQARFTPVSDKLDWAALIREGSVQHLTVTPADVGLEATGQPYMDLYFGYLNAPDIGRNILGDRNYQSLMADLKPNEHAIFIIANGSTAFKGSGFVRGGISDRIQVAQDMDTYTFRDTDYRNLYGIKAAGAPAFNESGIFIIRSASFSAAYPWSLVFLGHKTDKQTGAKTFANFDREYWLDGRYLEGGRPTIVRPDPVWLHIWKDKARGIAAFTALLLLIGAVYARRDALVRRCTRRDKRWVDGFKYFGWVASIGFVGFAMMAQPSITQVLTWFHALLFHWQWKLFLTDPYIFIFWWFIIITVFVWGRGLFCGWLCPFGSLTELLYKVGGRLGLARFQFLLPERIHHRLKWLKYGIFYGLLAVSFFSMGLAEKLAEVEPFKTTFLIGMFNRAWPYTLFVAVLLGLSLFTERPFCKYLCPLGAALAIPTTFRWFGLKRKPACTTCTACAAGCGSQAIDAQGVIDQRECMLCLDCMVMYYDEHACPPLSQERKRRERAGLPLTPVGSDGYYIPIVALPVSQPRLEPEA
ncbi:putative electron transport protein YccM [mine drainage metagenome]|uniref:Putative electron transport protein YccM n=1 Tax=mine drainage metagenome TaxID=410659 RepID=A0A1J5QNA1_9ZZZZ